jgi:hypothetical protein
MDDRKDNFVTEHSEIFKAQQEEIANLKISSEQMKKSLEVKIQAVQQSIAEKRSYTSESVDLLYTALAEAQREMPTAELNRTGGSKEKGYQFFYADLTELVRKSRPSLSKNGISVSQIPMQASNDLILITRLQHKSGQWQESRMKVMPEKEGNQGRGASLTYCKRQVYASIVGIFGGEDDDDAECENILAAKRAYK